MDRRSFMARSASCTTLVAVGSFTLGTAEIVFQEGCKPGTGTWVNEALSILQLLGPAVSGILNLAGVPIPPVVTTAINDLIDLIKKYEASPVDQQPTLITKIEAAGKFLQDNIAEILNAVHVRDTALQNKIIALVSFVVGEIASLLTLIPSLRVGASPTEAKAAYSKVPAKTADAFKKLYNEQMAAKVGDPSDDKASTLLLK